MSILDPVVDPIISRGINRSPGVGFSWSTQMPGVSRFPALTIANTLTGWGFYAGVTTAAFNRVTIPYFQSQVGYVANSILVRIRANNVSGAILATGTAALESDLSVQLFVSVSLSATIPSGTAIFVEFFTNGRVQFYDLTLIGGVAVFAFPDNPQTHHSLGINTSSPAALIASPTQRLLLFWAFANNSSAGTVELSRDLSAPIARMLKRIGSIQPGMIEIASVGSASWASNVAGSTFSGHGCYIGNQATPFNAISVLLWSFNISNVATRAVMRIRQMPADSGTWASTNPSEWALIAESDEVNLGCKHNEWREVTFALNKLVSGRVWYEVVTDGYIGLSGTLDGTGSPTIAAPPNSHYTTGGSLAIQRTWLPHSVHQTLWCRVGLADYSGGLIAPSREFRERVATGLVVNPTVTIKMPVNAANIIPALEGRELNLYLDNIIAASVPLSHLSVVVTCTKGTQFEGVWRYTPTSGDVGSTTLTVTVWNHDHTVQLATATSTLKTVALTHPTTAVSRKVLFLGDSTFADVGVIPEVVRMFNGDAKYTLTLVGSNQGSGNDSTGTSRSVAMEAIGGWSINRFSTDTTSAWTQINGTSRTGSPFLFSGSFNFASYLSAQSITMASGDWVIINHGINDIFSFLTDATTSSAISTSAAYLTQWITSIKAAVPGIRIGICMTIPPTSTQDSFGTNYPNLQWRKRYLRNLKLWHDYLISAYDSVIVGQVTLIPYHATVDTENNFPLTTRVFNARNPATYERQTNAVHPINLGYWQLADTLRSYLKAIES